MSKAGRSPIATPKGGGAVRGIGETFSPDMQTGRVASGFRSTYRGSQWPSSSAHAGVQQRAPERSVRHGVGAAVPGVSRKTGGATPRYDDSDVFVLSGAEDLVETGSEGARTHYRPSVEGLFARIAHVQDAT